MCDLSITFSSKEFIPMHLTVWALFVKARLEWPAGHDKRKYKKYFVIPSF